MTDTLRIISGCCGIWLVLAAASLPWLIPALRNAPYMDEID